MISAWSSQGLLATFFEDSLQIIDQTVTFSDPFYRHFLISKRQQNDEVISLQWNWNGSYLLVLYQKGSIEIFHQTAGIVNKFESVYMLKRNAPSICSFWCENRRKFSFNSNFSINTTANANNSSNLFSSKAFHLNFLPAGRMGFILVSSIGQMDVFIESQEEGFQVFTFKLLQDIITLMTGFAFQRQNGKVFLLLESVDSWFLFEFSDLLHAPQMTSKLLKTSQLNSKFIWSEAKESLVQLEVNGTGVNMIFYNHLDLSVASTIRSADINVEIQDLYFSSRAPYYLFVQCAAGQVSVLNWNGDLVKQLSLESHSIDTASSLMVSPNGLVVGKLTFLDNFPLFSTSPIGEINPKNIVVLRELLGKLISSTLNSSDSWDIFQLIRKSVHKCSNDEQLEDSTIHFPFISTLLAEWISLLEASNLPARDFYSKLQTLFKCLPDEFIDAYGVVDLVLRFMNVERILLANMRISTTTIEDYFETTTNNKWPESDQIVLEFDNLVSILPVLEEGLSLIQSLSSSVQNPISIIPLADECFRSVGLIVSASQAAQKQFKSKANQLRSHQSKHQALISFCDRATDNLVSSLTQLELFTSFLHSLRADPQIQPKCTKNIFLFLTEFYLDPTNLKRVHGNVLRIFSRYAAIKTDHLAVDNESFDGEFFDSIKCLNLPLSRTILLCRRCNRASSVTNKKSSRRELIFSASWQQTLWKSRCPCGSQRRLINL